MTFVETTCCIVYIYILYYNICYKGIERQLVSSGRLEEDRETCFSSAGDQVGTRKGMALLAQISLTQPLIPGATLCLQKTCLTTCKIHVTYTC